MALYLPDYNALFVHCPKTGGSFVVRTLRRTLGLRVREVGYKHSHKDLVGPVRERNKPFTFTLVRHPVSWYGSYWQMKMRRPRNGRLWYYWEPATLWHVNWELDPRYGDNDFARFIEKATTRQDYLHDMFGWYTGLGTSDQVDMIGKQETLVDDLIRFLDTIGVDYDKSLLVEAKRVNSAWGEKKALWTPELRQLVLDAEQRVLVDYGYDADGLVSGADGVPAARSPEPIVLPYQPKPWTPVRQRRPRLSRRVVRTVLPETTRRRLFRLRRRLLTAKP